MAPTKEDKEEKRGAHLRVPDHLKKPKNVYVPTGKPRGRAPGTKNKKTLNAEKWARNRSEKGSFVANKE